MKKYIIALLTVSSMMLIPTASSLQAQNQPIVVTDAKNGRVATEVFGRHSNFNAPRLSPDGSKIVFQLANNGENYIAWLDIQKKGARPNIIAKAGVIRDVGDREIFAWRWVGNETIVVSATGLDRVFDGRVGIISRLIAYDTKGGKPRPLAWQGALGNASNILHIDHEKEEIMVQRQELDSRLNEVINIDVKSGKYSNVQNVNADVDSWFADHNGFLRGGVGNSRGGTAKTLYRSSDKGPMKAISKVKDESFTTGSLTPILFLDEPDMAYTLSNHEGYAAVYKVNLATQELLEKVYGTEGYDVRGVIPNVTNNDIIGYRLFNGRNYVKYIDQTAREIEALFTHNFGKNNTTIISRSEDAKHMIIAVAKPSQRDTYYYYNDNTVKFKLLGYENSILKNTELNPVEAVDYKASDGMKIQAIITYPRHRTHRKNLPVIVMPHGGPFGVTDSVRFDQWAQSMAEQGYVVIQPNYRGSGGYGPEFVKEGRKPNGYGHRMQDDLNDAVAWFAKIGLIDSNRACIMGWSYGGYAAGRGAQRDPDLWKCAIAGAGIYDFPKMKSFDTRQFGSFGANFQATADDLISISTARHTDGPWAPILIVAAKEDARIPMEQSRILVSNLKKSGKVEGQDYKYIVQEDGTHNLPYEDVHIEWLDEAGKWAQRFNPAYIDSDPDKQKPIAIRSTGVGSSLASK